MHLKSLLLSLVAVSAAAPAADSFNNAYNFPQLGNLYSRISQLIPKGIPSTCDTSKINLPSYKNASKELPPPDGLKPMYVGIGRGTQVWSRFLTSGSIIANSSGKKKNYTCADSTSNSKPQAIGARASLFDATCLAADYPQIVEMVPGVIYNIPLLSLQGGIFRALGIDLMARHFFPEATTPEFNFDITPPKYKGVMMTKKQDQMDAKGNAAKGKYGAVPWLYLTKTTGTVGKFESVYRVDTASGSPPDTCQGMAASFEIEYSANYYFFGS
ncbi:hypothetical protein N7492_007135 [Penicillium capsulatum]|uniref:Malate dehydrogenase n=1 Tax=Penicillium capsulatum TaxID=69766 RepID=A0A9W9I1G3_9EURO|nr:hypothetical protein N7492_007135 [Penicillium capsulatum]